MDDTDSLTAPTSIGPEQWPTSGKLVGTGLSELWTLLGLQGQCDVHGCGHAKRLYDGVCRKHREWMKNYGTVDPPVCSFEDCGVTYDEDPSGQFRAGMCNKHYLSNLRADKRAKSAGPRFCVLEGCGIDISRGRSNQKACTPEHQVKAWMIDLQMTEPVRARINKNKREGDRRARKVNNPGYEQFTAADWFAVLVAADFRCTYCEDRTYDMQMDHVIPLSKGGPHCLSNVTPACGSCNQSKRDSTVEDWRAARRERKARNVGASSSQREGSLLGRRRFPTVLWPMVLNTLTKSAAA
ncbi:HNH endonuclease [Arthrobacter sp. ov118]|uniref:HNH endonuclease n=1 Tax=Arthrobacter sp. ov118 TaxID=1761747 RepID=UPI0015A707FD|nr:HNH endonuclease signature motif containing protein [Arthrobacter sp. ov118]